MTTLLDKTLALAVSFGDAPDYVKDAAEQARKLYFVQSKAESQRQLWTDQAFDASKQYLAAVKVFTEALAKWDPEGNNSGKLEEIKKVK